MKTHFATAAVAIMLSASPVMAQTMTAQPPSAKSNTGTMERAQVQNQYRYNENEAAGNKVRSQFQERTRTQNMFNRDLSDRSSFGRSGGSGGKSGGGNGGGGRR